MFRFPPPAKDLRELRARNAETMRKIILWAAIIALILIVWGLIRT